MGIVAFPVSYRLPARAGETAPFETPGVALRVRAGGQVGARIYFDRTSEDWVGQNSIEAVDGAVAIRKFDRLFVQWPTKIDATSLELEFFPCVTPVLDVARPPAGVGARLVANIEAKACASGDSTPIFVESAQDSHAELTSERFRYRPEKFVGGALVGDVPFVVTAYHRVSLTKRAIIARLNVSKVDTLTGVYSCSLETGWKRDFDTFGSNTQNHVHGPMLHWPRGGLEIEVVPTGALTLNGIVYSLTD